MILSLHEHMRVYLFNVRDSCLHLDRLLSVHEGSFLPPCTHQCTPFPHDSTGSCFNYPVIREDSLYYANFFFLASYSSSKSSQCVYAESPLSPFHGTAIIICLWEKPLISEMHHWFYFYIKLLVCFIFLVTLFLF